MPVLVGDLLLFFCLATWVTGMVIAIASLLSYPGVCSGGASRFPLSRPLHRCAKPIARSAPAVASATEMAGAKRSILTSSHRDIRPPFADETQRDVDSLIAASCDLLGEHYPLSPPF